MTNLSAVGSGVAGALAGIPIAAVAYAAPKHGRLRLPPRWWRGAPAHPVAVAAVALLAGAITALVGGLVLISPVLPALWIFAVIGIALAIIDARRRRLPYVLTGTLWITSILCFGVSAAAGGDIGRLLRAVGVGATTATIMLIIALALPGQLGLGDVALMGAIALNLGWWSWQAAALGMSCALLLQGAVGLAVRARTHTHGAIPMGPSLIAGWLLAVVVFAAR